MKKLFLPGLQNRFGLIVLLAFMLVCFSLATRIGLFIKSFDEVELSLSNIIGILFIGLFSDFVNASYFVIPLIVYLWLMPEKIYQRSWHRFVLYGLFFFFVFILGFNAISEWFFWDEFNTRYNFIAVDYLVYTTEVVGNIQQSYPIFWIIASLLLFTIAIVYAIHPWIQLCKGKSLRFKERTKWVLIIGLLPALFFFTITSQFHHFSANAYVNELSGNGMYELFAAYRNNELDYDRFYQHISNDEANNHIHALVKTKESEFEREKSYSIERRITNPEPERKLNVVMISVESLSADFLDAFGNTQHITPFLDSLATESLFFTNVYATGTRTVRGLEALSLCVPPTPGQSIVRRPNNEHLFSLGDVFDSKGYESKYIYGGYGYFDNMNYFFGHNSYTVIDRDALNDEDIDYENIWGVADENLFTLATREIEKCLAEHKPVFAHIMTTSNHRPYTYPEGRIDIPSHTGRAGAVKYTDYAIGKFIKESSRKSWFTNTIFVIVADHCASSAGKTELPVRKYHIPLLIYSPGNIEPTKVERLMSQIDIGPTLLGLLNFSYTSKFFGYDIFKLEPGRERAFISTYQTMGFIKHDSLVVLSPRKKCETFRIHDQGELEKVPDSDNLKTEAIAWYETTSYAFKNGLMKQ
ncbi:MAG: sulfatase-like hydrolase/transferase [Cyclobacteriaceae bacterium]|nr:sulfatase-like hydrolase/transferase [Cyclobacteriaceae bacterium]